MTEIAFHFNAPEKLAYACRLLRKAAGSGAQVVVAGEPELLQRLDVALWTFSATDFLPHCMDGEGVDPAVRASSPVVLTPTPQTAPHSQILVNLGRAVPGGFERFGRLIEVVSQEDAEDRELARGRWKHYASRGYAIQRHDLVLKG